MNNFKFFYRTIFIFLSLSVIGDISSGWSKNNNSGKKQNNRTDSLSKVISVVSMGAVGNGIVDDTKYFQKAIDSASFLGGGTVFVPHGKYLIDADISIKLKSHVTLQMVDSMAQLIAKPTNSDRYNVILIVNQTDVSIIGGKIIGDRDQHLGTTGEWGMGISVFGSNKVNISGTHISDCWGDGIIIGAQKKYNAPGACTFITIKNVVSDNNRRQGLSIEEVNNVVIDSCVFSNTHGTKPMDGIDIEPNGDSAQYINIKNCILAYNQGNGIEMNARSISSGRGTTIINIIVQHNYLHHNAYGGYLIRAKNVQFNYNKIQLNRYGPPIKAVDTVNCILAPNN